MSIFILTILILFICVLILMGFSSLSSGGLFIWSKKYKLQEMEQPIGTKLTKNDSPYLIDTNKNESEGCAYLTLENATKVCDNQKDCIGFYDNGSRSVTETIIVPPIKNDMCNSDFKLAKGLKFFDTDENICRGVSINSIEHKCVAKDNKDTNITSCNKVRQINNFTEDMCTGKKTNELLFELFNKVDTDNAAAAAATAASISSASSAAASIAAAAAAAAAAGRVPASLKTIRSQMELVNAVNNNNCKYIKPQDERRCVFNINGDNKCIHKKPADYPDPKLILDQEQYLKSTSHLKPDPELDKNNKICPDFVDMQPPNNCDDDRLYREPTFSYISNPLVYEVLPNEVIGNQSTDPNLLGQLHNKPIYDGNTLTRYNPSGKCKSNTISANTDTNMEKCDLAYDMHTCIDVSKQINRIDNTQGCNFTPSIYNNFIKIVPKVLQEDKKIGADCILKEDCPNNSNCSVKTDLLNIQNRRADDRTRPNNFIENENDWFILDSDPVPNNLIEKNDYIIIGNKISRGINFYCDAVDQDIDNENNCLPRNILIKKMKHLDNDYTPNLNKDDIRWDNGGTARQYWLGIYWEEEDTPRSVSTSASKIQVPYEVCIPLTKDGNLPVEWQWSGIKEAGVEAGLYNMKPEEVLEHIHQAIHIFFNDSKKYWLNATEQKKSKKYDKNISDLIPGGGPLALAGSTAGGIFRSRRHGDPFDFKVPYGMNDADNSGEIKLNLLWGGSSPTAHLNHDQLTDLLNNFKNKNFRLMTQYEIQNNLSKNEQLNVNNYKWEKALSVCDVMGFSWDNMASWQNAFETAEPDPVTNNPPVLTNTMTIPAGPGQAGWGFDGMLHSGPCIPTIVKVDEVSNKYIKINKYDADNKILKQIDNNCSVTILKKNNYNTLIEPGDGSAAKVCKSELGTNQNPHSLASVEEECYKNIDKVGICVMPESNLISKCGDGNRIEVQYKENDYLNIWKQSNSAQSDFMQHDVLSDRDWTDDGGHRPFVHDNTALHIWDINFISTPDDIDISNLSNCSIIQDNKIFKTNETCKSSIAGEQDSTPNNGSSGREDFYNEYNIPCDNNFINQDICGTYIKTDATCNAGDFCPGGLKEISGNNIDPTLCDGAPVYINNDKNKAMFRSSNMITNNTKSSYWSIYNDTEVLNTCTHSSSSTDQSSDTTEDVCNFNTGGENDCNNNSLRKCYYDNNSQKCKSIPGIIGKRSQPILTLSIISIDSIENEIGIYEPSIQNQLLKYKLNGGPPDAPNYYTSNDLSKNKLNNGICTLSDYMKDQNYNCKDNEQDNCITDKMDHNDFKDPDEYQSQFNRPRCIFTKTRPEKTVGSQRLDIKLKKKECSEITLTPEQEKYLKEKNVSACKIGDNGKWETSQCEMAEIPYYCFYKEIEETNSNEKINSGIHIKNKSKITNFLKEHFNYDPQKQNPDLPEDPITD